MYLTYRPVGDPNEDTPEAQEFTFIPGKTNTFDAEAIETVTDMTWEEFLMRLQKGSIKARRALLWIMLRKNHRGLRFQDVSFTNDEVELEYDQSEIREMLDNIEKDPRPMEEKESFIDFLNKQLATAKPAPGDTGKAPDPFSEENTVSP